MVLAYVLSTYPRPSLTFIRREIAALEGPGLTVHRFAMRRSDEDLVDEADQAEQQWVCYILEAGILGLVREALTRPRRWAAALVESLKLGRESRRGRIRHLIYLAEACVLRRRLEECNARHMHSHTARVSRTTRPGQNHDAFPAEAALPGRSDGGLQSNEAQEIELFESPLGADLGPSSVESPRGARVSWDPG
jgi:hypothetical protein